MRVLRTLGFVAALPLCGCMHAASVALPDSEDRSSVICEVSPQGTLAVSGTLQAPEMAERNHKAGILLVRHFAVDGKEVSARDLTFSPLFKCGYKYLAAGKDPEPFSLDLSVPDGAVRTEISVSKFACKDEVLLSEFKYGFVLPGPDRWRTQIAETEFNVQAGRFYEILVKGRVPPVDCTNQQALARCVIGFRGNDGELAADDSLTTGFVSGGRNKGVEYLCADQAVWEGDVFRWRFQVRAPGGAKQLTLEVKPGKCQIGALWGDLVVSACPPTTDMIGGMVEMGATSTNRCKISRLEFAGKSDVGKPVVVPPFSNCLVRELSGGVPKDAILSQPRLVEKAVREFWGADGEDQARTRKDDPVVTVSPNHGLIIGPEYSAPTNACTLVIRDYEGVSINPSMDWSMNPFTNSTWRLKYLSGYWIPFSGAAIVDERDYYIHCKSYWQSFMSRLSYPNGIETIAYNAHACAARIEAILLTMYGKRLDAETGAGFPSLRKQLAKDPLFLRQLLYQLSVDVGLIARHLRVRSFGLHNYNIIMATAILMFADCFKEHEFAHGYRDLALRIIFEHLDFLFEPDGFLREQSAFYHHLFTRYFTALYLQMRDNRSVDEKMLAAFKDRLERLVEVDFLMCPPDGMSVPMGDIPSNEMTRNECKAEARALDLNAERNPVFEGSFSSLPDISVFRESGIYIFRNPKEGRFLFVDLSDSLKVHGHRDLGSWQYYSQGVRWISDLGGPCEYGTKRHREFIASASHTLVEPVGISQSSGVAFGVELKDRGSSWELSCRSNVYGPTVEHVKKFVIAKDLSTFSVTDAFPKWAGEVRGRLTLAPDCDVTVDKDERTAFLLNGGSSIKVILPKARSHEKLRANASLRTNRLSEVWLLDSLSLGQEPVTYVVRDEK